MTFMKSTIHIVSFDIPFPANYGGAIDVFHKIRCLHQKGVNVILHCFQYGERKPSFELEQLCEKVYYYKRNTSLWNHLSLLPYNVTSRINNELKQHLLKDNFPIIFEVLHTCYLLNDVDLKHRIKLYRHSNIEHVYFNALAKTEKSILKKIYLYIEAFKLKQFERQITNASVILSVSKTDLEYFKTNYPSVPSYYLPSFHGFDEISITERLGKYILYHGNLSISENYQAAHWLIEHVFSKITFPVIIAGLNPPKHLIEVIKKYTHIKLIANCSSSEMEQLIKDAQIHCLYTEQATGLKLKLLHVAFSGKHILCNDKMVVGTELHNIVNLCNDYSLFEYNITKYWDIPFGASSINVRRSNLNSLLNIVNTEKLLNIIKL